MPDAQPGSTAHSYEVLGKLAEGGMTEIFLARAKGVGAVERFVVLKRLKRSVTSHVDLVKLFLDEARLAAQLQHPNVAQVFEVGKLGGSFFFAMEFVNGETLQSLMLHARGRKIQIPVRAVLTIAAAAAAGLHHAHDRTGTDGKALGIVHGEVSPTNMLVSQEGIVKLVDFGVAKAGETIEHKVSPYSSPEQCKGGAFDRRSDLFSLGIVLWELLTLDPLYQRASDADIRTAIETETPAKPSSKRYDVPPELDALILKLLAKDPAERFQNADELLAAIESLAQKLSILLSTADLSRMMRLWFGTKADPVVDVAVTEPLIVASEEIPDNLATTQSPIDDQLDHVRSAAAMITARATARSANPTGRQDKPTVPPELMDNPNENFEQIRDRILARARQKKETMRPHSVAAAGSSDGSADSGTPDRHSRITAQAPIAVIEEAVRQAGLAEPAEVEAKSNGRNGHVTGEIASSAITQPTSGEPDPAGKVVLGEDIVGPKSVSGELGSKPEGAKRLVDSGVKVHSDMGAEPEANASADASAAAAAAAAAAATAIGNAAQADAKSGAKDTADAKQAKDASDTRDAKSAATTSDAKDAKAAATSDAKDAKSDAKAAATSDAKDAKAATTSDAKDAKAAATSDAKDAKSTAASDAKDAKSTAASDAKDAKSDAKTAAREAPAATSNVAKAARETTTSERPAATARESTEGIAPGRPPWLVPVIGVAAAALLVLVVMKLRGGDDKPKPTNQPQTAQVVEPQPAPQPPPQPPQPPPSEPAVTPPAGSAATATGSAATGSAATGSAATGSAATGSAALGTGSATVEKKDPVEKAVEKRDPVEKTIEKKDPVEKTAEKKDPVKKDPVEKKDPVKKDPVEKKEPDKKEPETKKGIEELFAAGDFAKTNAACSKEIVFTPQKLEMCATAACQTKNTALAKRWINAISKASRPAMIEKCKGLGVDLDPAPTPAPAPAAPSPTP